MSGGSWRERLAPVARRLAGRNRWLAGAVVAMFVATAVLDPTIGAADAPPLLDLGAPSTPSTVAPAPPPAPSPPTSAVPVGGVASRVPGGVGGAGPTTPTTSSPGDETPTAPSAPDGPAAPEPSPCAAAAIVDLVTEAQKAIEAASGAPLLVDVGGLFVSLAGCGESGTPNPLDALGVVTQLLDALGIFNIPLPVLPPLPLPESPPPGFDALGPAVLPVCAEVIQQLVTAASVAPLLRVRTADVVAFFSPVVQVCALFAPTA